MKLKQKVQGILENHGLVGPADRGDATNAVLTLIWEQFAEQAITTPFLDRGRTVHGWDCWGLVVSAYRDVLGITLPTYEDYDTVRNHKALVRLFVAHAPEWHKVPAAIDGCVALIFRGALPLHAGLVIANGRRILHCEEGVGTVSEPIERFRIEGIYEKT